MKYVDIHSHLGFEDYGKDLDEVIKRMKDLNVGTISVGADLESSKQAVKVAEENENIWACIGQHPNEKKDEVFDELEYEKLLKNLPEKILADGKSEIFRAPSKKDDASAKTLTGEKVVAIGECGLDYYVDPKFKVESEKLKVTEEEKERQKKLFIQQIEFAIIYNKPLMLHIRDAHDDAYEILKNYKGKVRGNLHFFTSSLQTAKKFIELGFSISFPGIITYVRDFDKVIKNIPLEMIHAETDAPFASPIPHRGERNEPSYVIEVVKKIAEIREEDFERVRLQLLENAKRLFGIK